MKNVVTFETAKRLKEAGFPQPEPERGQVWYLPNSVPAYCYGKCAGDSGPFYLFMYSEEKGLEVYSRNLVKWSSEINEISFAPTATDIMWHLPSDYELYYSERNEDFVLHIRDERNEISDFFHDQNPAEAAAAAWLEIQKQKSDE